MAVPFHLSIFLIEIEISLTTKLANDFQISPTFSIKPPGGLFISSPFEGG